MNADDRLSLDPLGRVEGGNRIFEGSHVADVCPQPTNPDPLDELTQLGAIGYDDEVDWTDGDEDPVSACRHWLALP